MENFKSNLDFKQYIRSEIYIKKLSYTASKHICLKNFVEYACRAVDKNLQSYQIAKQLLQHFNDFAKAGLYIDHNNECGITIYNNKRGALTSKIYIGYQGYYKIVMRNPDFIDVSANVVYDNDIFEVEYGSSPLIKHKPNFIEPAGKLLFAYAVLRFKNGDCKFETVRAEELDKMKNLSMTKDVWATWAGEMQKKSAIKRLLKLHATTDELRDVIAVDEKDIDDEVLKVEFNEEINPAKQIIELCKVHDIDAKSFARFNDLNSENQEQCKAVVENFEQYLSNFKNASTAEKLKNILRQDQDLQQAV